MVLSQYTVLLSTTNGGQKAIIRTVKTYSEEQNFYLNANKTKIMKTDKTQTKIEIKIENDTIEEIEEFEYLCSIITRNGDINKKNTKTIGNRSSKKHVK